jgi:gliding motility-associated protein GldM
MAGAKETPRQKMIGMMYLVLTAMLALNVSKEILEAFVSVNENMVTTNKNFDEKLNDTYTQFSNMAATDKAAVKWYNYALEAKTLSDSLVNYLIRTRSEVILRCEPRNEAYYNDETGKVNWDSLNLVSLNQLKALDDYSTPSNYFLGEGDLLPGEAKIMKEKFEEYRNNILKTVKDDDAKKIKIGLRTDGKFKNRVTHEQMNWENYMFYHTILAADVVILNKYIAEVRNIEFEILTKLMSYVGAEAFKFNKIEAKVIPEKRNVFSGDEYKAQILVAAFDTTESPKVSYRMGIDSLTSAMMANATSVIGDQGIVNIGIPTNSLGLGEKKFAGVIFIKDPVNPDKFKQYPFSSSFNVSEPAATIAADAVNVFYAGIPNPLSISIPNVPPSDIICQKVSGSAVITQRNGNGALYYVKPTEDKPTSKIKYDPIILQASARIDGQLVSMGKKEFRVIEAPSPSITIAGGYKNNSPASRSELANYRAKNPAFITANPKDPLFESPDFIYTVESYEVSYNAGGYINTERVSGNGVSPGLRNIILARSPSETLTFKNIRIKYPSGQTRNYDGGNIDLILR